MSSTRADSAAAGAGAFDRKLLGILRIGLAACFIGHGALGFYHQTGWVPYFGVVGIGPSSAQALMPWVGTLDLMLALAVLVFPVRGLVAYMLAWTVWTALLRPLAGESFWEAIERAGNYGVPLALCLLLANGATRGAIASTCAESKSRLRLAWILRLTTVFLLLGHGALGLLVRKPLFVTQYNAIGLPGTVVEPLIGAVECLLALVVLVKPTRGLLVAILVWKLASEALAPIAGSAIWVFVEHGGSYAAPIALLYLLARNPEAGGLPAPRAPEASAA